MSAKKTDINYGPKMKNLMDGAKKTIVQQDDYRGMGGHGLEKHGGHGWHKQDNIGIGKDRTVNFRELKK